MDIKHVKLTNFLSHKLTSFAFPRGLTGLVGLNGTGKSSLVKDSVTWALWGRARCGGAGDDLIHKNEDHCKVEIKLAVNGVNYLVIRTRTRDKKTELFFAQDGGDAITNPNATVSHDLSRPVLKATQDDINKVLGMDYDIFRNSCCIEQGHADSFSKLTPKEAGQLILTILQLNNYSKYKIAATDKFMEAKLEHERVLAACDYLVDQSKELGNVKERIEEVKTGIAMYKQYYEESESVRKKLEKEKDRLQKEWNGVVLKLNSLNSEHNVVESELKKLDDKVNILDKVNGACPLCRTNLDKNTKESVKKKLRQEYHDLLDKKTTLKLKLDRLNVEYGPAVSQGIADKAQNIKAHQTRAKESYSKMLELQGELKALKNPAAKTMDFTDKINENKKLAERLKKDQLVYSELRDAFSHKGIPLLIIDNAIKELQVLVNDNLKLLCDLPVMIKFVTQRESSTGDLLDTFQILIQDGIESRTYFNYSGGERMLIDLSIRLGLSELLSRRNNFKVETLIIDEGLGSLDENNQLNFLNTLKRLTKKFKKVILITHTEAKDYLQSYVETVKKDDVSHIKLDKLSPVCYN